jgi:nickel-dependent lactate racemase
LRTFQIPYGQRSLALQLPPAHGGELLSAAPQSPAGPATAIQAALEHPLDSPPLEEFLAGCRSLLILVNDETRPTPTGRVLEALWARIAGLNFTILVATGTHRASHPENLEKVFSPLWPEVREKVLFHDSRQEGGMIFLGTTFRGTRVLLNPQLMMADRVLAIGSVEPHYFAGYTGGRKLIVPGIAGYSTIVTNHSLALEPGSQPLRLLGNPVHEDLMEALQFLTMPPIFSVQLVLTPDHEVAGVYAGSLLKSFLAATRQADEVFTVPFREKSDILVAVALPPMDLDLYQSQKPIEHGKLALKEGGILILVMPCRQGAGPSDFQELLSRTGDFDQARQLLDQPYRLGFHRVSRNLRFVADGGEIWGVTDLDPDFLSRTFIRPKPDLQKAVDEAIARKGPNARANILMNASLCVPKQKFG